MIMYQFILNIRKCDSCICFISHLPLFSVAKCQHTHTDLLINNGMWYAFWTIQTMYNMLIHAMHKWKKSCMLLSVMLRTGITQTQVYCYLQESSQWKSSNFMINGPLFDDDQPTHDIIYVNTEFLFSFSSLYIYLLSSRSQANDHGWFGHLPHSLHITSTHTFPFTWNLINFRCVSVFLRIMVGIGMSDVSGTQKFHAFLVSQPQHNLTVPVQAERIPKILSNDTLIWNMKWERARKKAHIAWEQKIIRSVSTLHAKNAMKRWQTDLLLLVLMKRKQWIMLCDAWNKSTATQSQSERECVCVDQFRLKSYFKLPKNWANRILLNYEIWPANSIFGALDKLMPGKWLFMSASRCHNNHIKMIFRTNYSMPMLQFRIECQKQLRLLRISAAAAVSGTTIWFDVGFSCSGSAILILKWNFLANQTWHIVSVDLTLRGVRMK